MPVTQEQLSHLRDFFPAEALEWRPGSTTKDGSKGMALAYLAARAVMDRLDKVCGPGNWRSHLIRIDKGFICELSICVENADGECEWVTKSDVSDESDIEALKGSASGALKRAAVHWGIGRYLYDFPTVWHPMKKKPNGGYYKVFDGTPKVPAKYLPKKNSPQPKPQEPQESPEVRTNRFLEDEVYPIGEAKGYGRGELRQLLRDHFTGANDFTEAATIQFIEGLDAKS